MWAWPVPARSKLGAAGFAEVLLPAGLPTHRQQPGGRGALRLHARRGQHRLLSHKSWE